MSIILPFIGLLVVVLGLAVWPDHWRLSIPVRRRDEGFAGNNMVWTIVGVLLIIVLLIWILGRR